MFSPILATRFARASSTVMSSYAAALNASTESILLASAVSATWLANARKLLSIATKSVSQLTSAISAVVPAVLAKTTPSAAIRPAFLAALIAPDLRMFSIASSMSPSASTSAFLQSIIPAAVRSRSSLTCLAVIAIVEFLYFIY